MARSRNIKPGFFLDENLASLDPLARILFAGLWCMADKEGRLEDRPARIKVQVLPYDNCDIGKYLDELRLFREPYIHRYEVDGKRYIQIVNWERHQNPHKNESDSIIPAYDPTRENSERVPIKSEALGLIPDSLNLIPDSGFPPPLTDSGAEAVPVSGRAETIKAWQSYRLEILGKGIGESPHEYDWVEDTVRWMKAITADDPITNPYDMITDAINEARLRKTPPDNPVAWVKKVIADWLDELRKEAARGAQAQADVTG